MAIITGRLAGAVASAVAIAAAAGCVQTEDLAHFARLEETERIVLLTYPAFEKSRDGLMRAVPPQGVQIAGDEAKAFVEAMAEVVEADMPQEAKPAFALVFFTEDPLEFRTVLIDQYLNFWPGFEYINEPFKGTYCEASDDARRFLLGLIFKDPGNSAHLLECLRKSEPGEPDAAHGR